MSSLRRPIKWGKFGPIATVVAVALILAFYATQIDWNSFNSAAPQETSDVQVSAGPSAGTDDFSRPADEPPAAVSIAPAAEEDRFFTLVLAYEATRYMEDAEAKNAALARVATPEFLAANSMPPNEAKTGVTVKAIPEKSQYGISDEYTDGGETYRVVWVFPYVEKYDSSGNMISFNKDGYQLNTWVLDSDKQWKIARQGILPP